jgi:hypothetical protein
VDLPVHSSWMYAKGALRRTSVTSEIRGVLWTTRSRIIADVSLTEWSKASAGPSE